MNGDPTVLGMIDEKLGDISTDVKEIKKDMKAGAVKMENHEGRIKTVERDTKELKGNFITHVNNGEKHYNPTYSESLSKKLWRKKPEIATAGGLGTFLAIVLFKLLEAWELM